MERIIDPRGKESITLYRLLEAGDKYSLLEAELLTGRSHQIRVHFKSLGHSILGDSIYSGADQGPMYLCSYYLKFREPLTGEYIEIDRSSRLEDFRSKLRT